MSQDAAYHRAYRKKQREAGKCFGCGDRLKDNKAMCFECRKKRAKGQQRFALSKKRNLGISK